MLSFCGGLGIFVYIMLILISMKSVKIFLTMIFCTLLMVSCSEKYGKQDWSQPLHGGIAVSCKAQLSADEYMTWSSASKIGLYCPQSQVENADVTIAASSAGSDVGNFYTTFPWAKGENVLTAYCPYSASSTASALVGTLSGNVLQAGVPSLDSYNTFVGTVTCQDPKSGDLPEIVMTPLFETAKMTVSSTKYTGLALDRVTVRTVSGAPLSGTWSYNVGTGAFAYTDAAADNMTVTLTGTTLAAEPTEIYFLCHEPEVLSEAVNVEVILTSDGGNLMLAGEATLTAATSINVDSFSPSIVGDDSINLADPDGDGLQETANCYVAGQPGMTYRFPATIMGNGKTLAPAPADFAPVSGTAPGITPSLLNPKSVKLMWQTEQSLITNVMLKNGCVYFTLNGEEGGTLTPGNALIAVFSDENATGTILWSWHIWVTAVNLDANLQTWKVHSSLDAYSAYQDPQLMDRNLGALEVRGWEVNGNNLDHGLIYQWGRKDPFVGADDSKWGSTAMRTTYDCNNEVIGGYEAADAYSSAVKWTYVNLVHLKREDLGKYPMAYYYSGTTKNDQFWMAEVCHDLWGCPDYGKEANTIGEKTIYDPCPPGYRVMNAYAVTGATTALAGGKFTAVAEGSNLVNYSTYSANKEAMQVKYDGTNIAYLPANGITYFESNKFPVTRTGNYGYLWSSMMTSNYGSQAYRLHFDTANFNSMGRGYASYGHGVRCERIK